VVEQFRDCFNLRRIPGQCLGIERVFGENVDRWWVQGVDPPIRSNLVGSRSHLRKSWHAWSRLDTDGSTVLAIRRTTQIPSARWWSAVD
jgi:hypothetical protein